MRLYTLLCRVGPFDLRLKIGVLVLGCFLPFIGAAFAVVWSSLVWTDGVWLVLLVVGSLALAGAGCAALMIGWLLAPVDRVNRALERYLQTRVHKPLPQNFDDALGRLMANSSRLMSEASVEIDAAIAEAETDPLTGLLNRRGFERMVQPRTVGTVLFVDADHFKRINDEWGHAVGDETLVAMADAISAALRSRDIVARIGGEEFAIFAEETVTSRAMELAERVRQKVSRNVSVWRRPVTVSVGVAVSTSVVDLGALMQAADNAVYDAKHSGRDCVALASLDRAA